MMLLFVAIAGVTAWGFFSLPTGFLPVEDQGYFIISAQLPDAASQARTKEVMDKLEKIIRSSPAIENINFIGGQNVFEQTVSSNNAACYATFKDWARGPGPA